MSPKHWSFGSAARTINREVIKLAKNGPGPTAYDPEKIKSQAKVGFGQKLLDLLSKR